jgi:plastocyanin
MKKLLIGLMMGSCLLFAGKVQAQATGTITGTIDAAPKKKVGVVLYLSSVKGSFRPPARPVLVDQKSMTFVPHIIAVQKGGAVLFHNSDSVRHNVFTPDGDKFDMGSWGQGESKLHFFPTTGVFHLLCNVHPEMGAVVVVVDNPYFSVSDATGKFQISNVPAGSYTMKVWSEKGDETSQQVVVPAGGIVNLSITR